MKITMLYKLKKIILLYVLAFEILLLIISLVLDFIGLSFTNYTVRFIAWISFILIIIGIFQLLLKIRNSIIRILFIILHLVTIFYSYSMLFFILAFDFHCNITVIDNKKFIMEEHGFLFDTNNMYYDYINPLIQYKNVRIIEKYADKDIIKSVIYYDHNGNIIKKIKIPVHDNISIKDYYN